MSRLTRDGTAEPVSRDQILRHARGQGNVHFPCSADHEQDWQPYPVDPYSAICDDHTYIHTYILKKGIYRSGVLCVLCKYAHNMIWNASDGGRGAHKHRVICVFLSFSFMRKPHIKA